MKTFNRWVIACLALIAFLAPLKFGTPVVNQSAMVPPKDFVEWVYTSWPNQIVIILVFAVLLWLVLDPNRLAARVDLLFVLPLIFLVTQVASLPGSINHQASSDTVMLFAACMLVFYAAAWYARDGAAAWSIFGGFGLATFLIIVLALEQHFGGLQATREFAAAYMEPSSMPRDLLSRMMSNRVFGTLVYPNALAGYLVVTFAPTLTWIWARSRTWDVRVKWATLVFVGGLMVYCLLLTGSRGGFAAFAVMMLVGLGCLLGREPRFKWVVPVTVVALVAVFFVGKSRGLIHVGTESLESRLDYWQGAWKIGRDHVWLGTGPGTFGSIYPKYKTALTEEAQIVHNSYLQMWSDSGIVAAVVFALLWLVALFDGFKLARQRQGDAAAIAVCAAVAGWVVHGLVDFDLYVPGVALPAFLLLGILQGLKELTKVGPVKPRGQTKWLVGFLCAAVIATVAWMEGRDLQATFVHARVQELEASNPVAALQEAQRAAELASQDSHYYVVAGDLATRLGRFDEAIRYYRGAIDNDPYRPSYHWRLARAEMAAHGLTDRAIEQLRQAVALNPSQKCDDPQKPCYRKELAAAEETVRQSTNDLLQSAPAKDQ
jgi:tetratricopeptide (TPR) repeat protein